MGKAKILMGFAAWFVKFIWPWIVKNVWPSIEKMVLEFISEEMGHLFRQIKQSFDQRRKTQEDALKRAAQAEEQASKTDDPVEAARLQAVAEVWREVAEQFRKENEALREELEKHVENTKQSLSTRVSRIPVGDLLQSDKQGRLRIKGASAPLAALPALTRPEKSE